MFKMCYDVLVCVYVYARVWCIYVCVLCWYPCARVSNILQLNCLQCISKMTTYTIEEIPLECLSSLLFVFLYNRTKDSVIVITILYESQSKGD